MRPFHQSKRSDNKRYAEEVRWGICFENLTNYFIPKGGRKYSHTNSYNSAMTVIAQDDHLTAGAWAACDVTNLLVLRYFCQHNPLFYHLNLIPCHYWSWQRVIYFVVNIFVRHTFPMSKMSIKTKTVLTMTDMTECTELLEKLRCEVILLDVSNSDTVFVLISYFSWNTRVLYFHTSVTFIKSLKWEQTLYISLTIIQRILSWTLKKKLSVYNIKISLQIWYP